MRRALASLALLGVACTDPMAGRSGVGTLDDTGAPAEGDTAADTGGPKPAATEDVFLDAVAVVDNGAWELLSAEDDPFDDRPGSVTCASTGFGEEEGALEVDTELCGYGTFEQPLSTFVPAGTRLLVIWWHLELWAPEAAEGHVALTIGEDDVLDETIAIPGLPATHRTEWFAPRDLEAGEPVRFHVHNHGYNNWALGLVQADTLDGD